MKRITFVVSSSIFLVIGISLNCSKKSDPPPPPEVPVLSDATFKFTANGTTYIWNGSDGYISRIMRNLSDPNNTNYYIFDIYKPGIFNSINLSINSTDLSETTYKYIQTIDPRTYRNHSCQLPGTPLWASFEVGDFGEVTISKIVNGYADGSFVAKLTANDANNSKVEVIDGQFTKVKICKYNLCP